MTFMHGCQPISCGSFHTEGIVCHEAACSWVSFSIHCLFFACSFVLAPFAHYKCQVFYTIQVYASQWRDAVEAGKPQPPLSAGFTYELCAGIVDKSKSLEDIAREEVSLYITFPSPLLQLPLASVSCRPPIDMSRSCAFAYSVHAAIGL